MWIFPTTENETRPTYSVFIHFVCRFCCHFSQLMVVLEPIPAAFRPHHFIKQDKQPTTCTYSQLRVSQITSHAYFWNVWGNWRTRRTFGDLGENIQTAHEWSHGHLTHNLPAVCGVTTSPMCCPTSRTQGFMSFFYYGIWHKHKRQCKTSYLQHT